MNDGGTIAILIGMVASLVLALRSYNSHRLGFERTAGFIVAWIVIIAGLAFLIQRFSA
ncbi:MAG TPA: hypothetical protein VHG29_01010 [Novosphingobium sp.]|nr:hypothetical protein [Novosphingobium sp.]